MNIGVNYINPTDTSRHESEGSQGNSMPISIIVLYWYSSPIHH